MAILTVAPISTTQQADALVAAAGGGDSFQNTGKECLRIRNAGGGAITLTVVASGTDPCNYGVAATPAHDLVQSIPNDSAVHVLGPFPPKKFNDVNGRVQLTYSGVTSVTVQPQALPPAA